MIIVIICYSAHYHWVMLPFVAGNLFLGKHFFITKKYIYRKRKSIIFDNAILVIIYHFNHNYKVILWVFVSDKD
jgi:hypothetical protein